MADGHRAFIGLGSNLSGLLGDSSEYVDAALERLGQEEGLVLIGRSGLYQSEPWGNRDQPPFINAVAEVISQLSPRQLLEVLLHTENELGREREEKWGPRLIDLDLLSFDDCQLDTDELKLPHPHMHERAFVLKPLLELDPDFVIPGRGTARGFLKEMSDAQGVLRI